mgnify:CR=1 FL=1
MPKNIRVYELAREMGMTNAEVLDLCVSLGIGVKSHSSGMVEAQADRARRKADREGLRREVQDRKSTRLNSSHALISYAVFCLKKKNTTQQDNTRSEERRVIMELG